MEAKAMKSIAVILSTCLMTLAVSANAGTIFMTEDAKSLFLNGTYNAMPSQYWESANSHTQYLKSQADHTYQWKRAFSNQYDDWNSSTGCPSLTEPGAKPRQCTALAKVASNTVGQNYMHTSNWYPNKNEPIIPSSLQQTYDISYLHSGKMIAYFGENPNANTSYVAHIGSPNHVGYFLKYEYDGNYRIRGFWMADENWDNKGSIGKHFVFVGGSGRHNARNYYVVDVRWFSVLKYF